MNVYELDETCLGELDVLRFEDTSHEWVEFVKSNRLVRGFEHSHDIVVGPVADDRVYNALTLFLEGNSSEEQLVRELLTYRLRDQWLFHTARALASLSYVQSITVTRDA